MGKKTVMIKPAEIGNEAKLDVHRHGVAPSKAEAEGRSSEFREAMQKGTAKDTDGDTLEEACRKSDAKKENEAPLSSPFSGDALLRSLGQAYTPLETQTAAAYNTRDIQPLAAELAERILVNLDNRVEGGEVRVTLKESLLPDTEIILRKEGDRLTVQLVSANPASLETLRLAQNTLLDKLLALGRDVSVEVTDNQAGENSGSGHPGARSRGLDYLPENG
jgi:type III secretion system needle length determinant